MADIDNRIALVIPAYEPSGRLAALLEELVLGWPGPIVVVDDGSSTSCSVVFDRARALGATVLVHGLNRGKGAALKTAFSYLLEQVPTVAGPSRQMPMVSICLPISAPLRANSVCTRTRWCLAVADLTVMAFLRAVSSVTILCLGPCACSAVSM